MSLSLLRLDQPQWVQHLDAPAQVPLPSPHDFAWMVLSLLPGAVSQLLLRRHSMTAQPALSALQAMQLYHVAFHPAVVWSDTYCCFVSWLLACQHAVSRECLHAVKQVFHTNCKSLPSPMLRRRSQSLATSSQLDGGAMSELHMCLTFSICVCPPDDE